MNKDVKNVKGRAELVATNFFSRWSQRKLEGNESELETVELEEVSTRDQEFTSNSENELTEASIEVTQQEQSELSVASLLSSEVESAVKKAALRKLFLSGQFSEIDGLNDYDHDYKSVKSLSSEVASQLRDWINSKEQEESEDQANLEQPEMTSLEPSVDRDDEFLESDQELVGQNIPHKQ